MNAGLRTLAAIVAVGLAACGTPGPQAFEGHWAGTGMLGDHPFDVRLSVVRAGDSLRATVASTAQLLLDEPLRQVRVQGGVLRGQTGAQAEQVVLEGRRHGDSLLVRGRPPGEAAPGFPDFTLRLVRTPLAPEPFTRRPLTVDHAGVRLAGTLFVPAGPGPHPAVVLLQGSSRTEATGYYGYAAHFARAGIAALAFDKRGSGASTGRAEAATGTIWSAMRRRFSRRCPRSRT